MFPMFNRCCGLGFSVSTSRITPALHPNILWAALNVLLENGSVLAGCVTGATCHTWSHLWGSPGSHHHPPDSEEVPAAAKATHSLSLYQQLCTSENLREICKGTWRIWALKSMPAGLGLLSSRDS